MQNFFNILFPNKEKNIQLLFLIAIFIFWFLLFKNNCPCPPSKKNAGCYRFEIFGVQFNHIYTFLALGYFFPEYFYAIQILGVIWELIEYYIHKYETPKLRKKIGGCFGNVSQETKNTFPHNLGDLVAGNSKKKLNPIDKFFNIKNSSLHGWHHSVAEIIVNIISFIIGSYLKKTQNISSEYIVLFLFVSILSGV